MYMFYAWQRTWHRARLIYFGEFCIAFRPPAPSRAAHTRKWLSKIGSHVKSPQSSNVSLICRPTQPENGGWLRYCGRCATGSTRLPFGRRAFSFRTARRPAACEIPTQINWTHRERNVFGINQVPTAQPARLGRPSGRSSIDVRNIFAAIKLCVAPVHNEFMVTAPRLSLLSMVSVWT